MYCVISYDLSFSYIVFFFFFNDTATTEIYTLSLHDALPISVVRDHRYQQGRPHNRHQRRSEEHTSELQSQFHLVCRLLLEKKKKKKKITMKKKKKKKIGKILRKRRDC